MSKDKESKQKKNNNEAFVTGIAIALGVIVVVLIGMIFINKSMYVDPVADFSKGLNDDGTISDVQALSYVTLCDYKNISVNKSELEISDEEVQEYIEKVVQSYPIDITDPGTVIKDGDNINFDFLGKIDEVPFEGGSTNGQGTDAVMGAGGFIPGFEDQIIGHKVGETFDIYVTFPEDYAAELAGKDAVFTITINSVKGYSEFNDEFVEANLSNIALTADAFIDYYKNIKYQTALYSYIQKYVVENSTVKEYPKKYLKIVKGKMKYDDQKSYEATNAAYMQNYGKNKYETFNGYVGGMSDKEYEAFLSQEATKQLDQDLVYQAILEDAGLEVTSDDVLEVLTANQLDSSSYQSYENTYGKGYLYHQGVVYTVIKYLADVVNVIE